MKGMSWMAKISLITVITLFTSVFMYQGWLKPMMSRAAVTSLQSWTNINDTLVAATVANTDMTVTSTGTFTPQTSGTGKRLLLVAFSMSEGSDTIFTSGAVTFGGVTVNKIVSSATTGRAFSYLGYILDANIPASGTAQVTYRTSTATTNNSVRIFCSVYDGVDQNSPITSSALAVPVSSGTQTFSTPLLISTGDQAVLFTVQQAANTSTAVTTTPIGGVWSNISRMNTSAVTTQASDFWSRTTSNAVAETEVVTWSSSARGSAVAVSLASSVDLQAGTTLFDGLPFNSGIVNAGTASNKISGFAFATTSATGDSITDLSVTTTGTDAIASLSVSNEAGTTPYFTTLAAPTSGDVWTFTGGTPIPVTGSKANYKVVATFKARAAIPNTSAPVTAYVSDFTSGNALAKNGTNNVTGRLTIIPPAPLAAAAAGPIINWVKNFTADSVIVIRYPAAATPTFTPADGIAYTTASVLPDGGTVVYAGTNSTYTQTSLTAGDYFYRAYEYHPTYLIYSQSFLTLGPYSFASITSFTPASLVLQSTVTVDVYGTNFVNGAAVTFGSASRFKLVGSTVFIDSTHLQQSVTGFTTGTSTVVVSNPGGGGATSATNLTVSALPVVTTVAPLSSNQDTANLNVVITGTGFVTGAIANFGGAGITVNSTTYTSATSLTANIAIAANATLGTRDVVVTNPDGGLYTREDIFTVAQPLYTTPGLMTFPHATASSIIVNVPYSGDANNNNACVITWGTDGVTYPSTATVTKSNGVCSANVTGLSIGTDGDGKRYYFKATFTDANNTVALADLTGSYSTVASKLTHNSQNLSSDKYPQGWGVQNGKYDAFTCSTCHSKNTTNKELLAMSIKAPAGETWGYAGYSTASVNVQSRNTDLGNDSEHTTSTNICEVCHSATGHHRYTNPAANHYGTTDCTKCHSHNAAFKVDTTLSGCSGCHGNPPESAYHASVVTGQCTPCHSNVNADTIFTDPALHRNGTVEVGSCVVCHNRLITRTKGRPGVVMANIVAEFNKAWSHKRSAGGNVTDADCIVCHLEGNSATGKVSVKHADGNIDLRDPDGATPETGITNISGQAFVFQRFSTSYAPGTRSVAGHLSNSIDNVVTQNFCLKCHDGNGATNSGARVSSGSQFKPFGTTIQGAGYVYPMSGATGGVVDIDRQVSAANASAHPVKGPRNNSFASYSGNYNYAAGSNISNRNRMLAPYGVVKQRGVTGQPGVVINCFDCHNQPGTPLTLRTVTAHGSANTLRGTASIGNTVASATNAVTLCIVCHANYDTNTTANHGNGSAMNFAVNSGMTVYFRYGCNYCHSSNPSQVRPFRGEDMHGFDRFAASAGSDAMWPVGATDTYKPYAFMRNTWGWTTTSWKPLSGPNVPPGTATCGGSSINQQGCTGENHSGYTPGGAY
jgi:hypothetical protein